jgi:ribonuclease T1
MAPRLITLLCMVALVPLVWAGDTATVTVPEKAYAVLERILERNGEPPPGHVGGRVFHNRERRLPRGRYREYDVNPRVRGKDRGPERIVIDRDTGQAWYTADHYRTFVLMERP